MDERPGPPESLRQSTRSGLQTIIQRTGAKRRTDPLLARLDEAFDAEGIATFPRLTDPRNRPDEPIYLFGRDHQPDLLPVQRQRFLDEPSLWDFIWANRHEFDELRGLSNFESERRMTSGRRFDLFCKRPRLSQLVGIELKLGDINDRAVGQCLQYIDDIAKEATDIGWSARFILITGGQPNSKARSRIQAYAQSLGVEVTFLLYRVELTLDVHP